MDVCGLDSEVGDGRDGGHADHPDIAAAGAYVALVSGKGTEGDTEISGGIMSDECAQVIGLPTIMTSDRKSDDKRNTCLKTPDGCGIHASPFYHALTKLCDKINAACMQLPPMVKAEIEHRLADQLTGDESGCLTYNLALAEMNKLVGEGASSDDPLSRYRVYLQDRSARAAAFKARKVR